MNGKPNKKKRWFNFELSKYKEDCIRAMIQKMILSHEELRQLQTAKRISVMSGETCECMYKQVFHGKSPCQNHQKGSEDCKCICWPGYDGYSTDRVPCEEHNQREK